MFGQIANYHVKLWLIWTKFKTISWLLTFRTYNVFFQLWFLKAKSPKVKAKHKLLKNLSSTRWPFDTDETWPTPENVALVGLHLYSESHFPLLTSPTWWYDFPGKLHCSKADTFYNKASLRLFRTYKLTRFIAENICLPTYLLDVLWC